MPSRPTPAAARYNAAGEPRPPAPSMSKAQEGLITRVARLEQAQRMVMLIEQEQLLLQAAGEGHRESIATATA